MYPICFELLGRPIYWYGVFVAFGFLVAVANWHYLGVRDGRPAGFASEMGFWAMLSGLLGARVAFVIANLDDYLATPLEMIRIDRGGLIYYGGFIGGFIGMALFARLRRISLLDLGDYALTGLVLGHAFGRMGCFLNGCCFGKLCSLPLAVSFPPGSPASMQHAHDGFLAHSKLPSLGVHATQLYEASCNLLVYGILLFAYVRRKRKGEVAALYLILYPVSRFLIEFLRGDMRLEWGGLTLAQLISLALFLSGCALWAFVRRTDSAVPSAA